MNSDHFSDPNGQPQYYSDGSLVARHSRAMETASVVLAVMSVLSSLVFYIAVPCGALAILFSLLSRGNTKLTFRRVLLIVVSSCGMLTSVVFTAFSFYQVMNSPEMRRSFERIFNLYADGMDLEYDFDDVFGRFFNDSEQEQVPYDDAAPGTDDYRQFFDEFFWDGSGPGMYDTVPAPETAPRRQGGEYI